MSVTPNSAVAAALIRYLLSEANMPIRVPMTTHCKSQLS
jgi:hypothetical protein